jgi:nucleoside-diphosphate-sugar epimerase
VSPAEVPVQITPLTLIFALVPRSLIFGPLRCSAQLGSQSVKLVAAWVRGERPVESRLSVDVRDVATAHLAAGIKLERGGEGGRYLLTSERRTPSAELRDILVAAGGSANMTADVTFRGGLVELGEKEVHAQDELKEGLGVVLRGTEETMRDMVASLNKLS